MPFVDVTLVEGRPPEKLRELLVALTDTVVETLDCPPSAVRVVVRPVPPEHWAVAGVPKSEESSGARPA